jgi:hypothetical protein
MNPMKKAKQAKQAKPARPRIATSNPNRAAAAGRERLWP